MNGIGQKLVIGTIVTFPFSLYLITKLYYELKADNKDDENTKQDIDRRRSTANIISKNTNILRWVARVTSLVIVYFTIRDFYYLFRYISVIGFSIWRFVWIVFDITRLTSAILIWKKEHYGSILMLSSAIFPIILMALGATWVTAFINIVMLFIPGRIMYYVNRKEKINFEVSNTDLLS